MYVCNYRSVGCIHAPNHIRDFAANETFSKHDLSSKKYFLCLKQAVYARRNR